MDATIRIDEALEAAVTGAEAPDSPPKLAAAVRYAVFPGGARVRPQLCLAVAGACGAADPKVAEVAVAAGAAIELLHCASLVHDDLPCFDDAPVRRGKPSVHRAFGERIAVLTGDALIVLAFETLALGAASDPRRLAALLLTVGRSVGMPHGISAGQAWECEPSVGLSKYQRAKTGSLFSAAAAAGAQSAGFEADPWRTVGDRIGEAYQVADDLHDVVAEAAEIGKPVGRDEALGRPNAAVGLGIQGAVARLEKLIGEAVDAIPDCPGADQLREVIRQESRRFMPKSLLRHAA